MWYFGHARGASVAHGGSSEGGGGDDGDVRGEASDSSESSEAEATIADTQLWGKCPRHSSSACHRSGATARA
jgi:hypothetical protein